MIRKFLLVALALLLAGPVLAETLPQDIGGFTDAIAARFRTALPQAKVTVDSPLTLVVDLPGKPAGMHSNLDRMWRFCRDNAAGCDAGVDEFVKNMAVSLTAPEPTPDAAALRVVVRATADLDGLAQALQKQSGKDPGTLFVGPIAGELSWILVLDLPTSVHYLNDKGLEELGLSREQAYQRGLQNLAGELHPFAESVPMPAGGRIGAVTGSYYASSRLLQHDEWKSVADKMVGPLLVAAPGANLVLYADGGWPDMPAKMRNAAQQAATENQKPISTQVLKWTATGWEVVSP